ncbi:MAG: glycosyltransferase family 2 protein [Bacteroidota bacterium]|nr:glycosyltransferase family 2 protein [Bacteroidota bacterium]MDP4215838.1 glycosyltransferase family 2 protein [Bacteroidota bacterium]MDP4248303.1 glycosyltransferase family 2 protein [Bacteroidota bacterium]MDP4255094.1 glycosyltransferase family 2 protein [Bacteroidota bacterium]MDP4260426.1 glycosyltransferase family 2 protein [Bacteroidota bacterium]
MNISIVIPVLDEEESLPELCSWIRRVMEENHLSYEIILVDDGSTDRSWEVIESLSLEDPRIRGIKFQRNYGKSAALNEGFVAAQGDVVITMDADMQDSPDEIPALRRMILEENYDLVSGWKKVRHDPASKTIPSRFFNWTAAKVTRIPLHDFNCGLKAYRNRVVKSIEVYGEMHRYVPVIAKWSGFRKIGEKVVQHRARKYGSTKFGGLGRGMKGLLDLVSIMFVGKYGKRPMHFFGPLGVLSFFLGFGLFLYLGISKLVNPQFAITIHPSFYFGLTLMIIGSQLFLTGFIAEMISRNAPGRNVYLVEKRIGAKP